MSGMPAEFHACVCLKALFYHHMSVSVHFFTGQQGQDKRTFVDVFMNRSDLSCLEIYFQRDVKRAKVQVYQQSAVTGRLSLEMTC